MTTYLVIGSGGREHALAWRLAHDDPDASVYVAPGNAGIARDPAITGGCIALDISDFDALAAFAQDRQVDLTVVGPEAPLCAGLVDEFERRGLAVFGPRRAAAQLEASKSFAKEIMKAAGVPSAAYGAFDDLEQALAYVRAQPHPLVIKADGLAAGKGVVISESVAESEATLESFMAQARFGEASQKVIIEERLEGPELSFMVVTDGETIVPLSTSQDHKRVGEGDTGPNTGGMGAITPSPNASRELEEELVGQVIRPTLDELARRGITYRGFLYAGLMLTEAGPRVLEFNVRLGDPETQALLWAMESNLAQLLRRAAEGNLPQTTLATARHACCVVLASRGYPGKSHTGEVIAGLDAIDDPEVKVFHAATALDAEGRLVNAGGRVLGVTARGASFEDARARAYAAVKAVSWEGMHYRRDIGGSR